MLEFADGAGRQRSRKASSKLVDREAPGRAVRPQRVRDSVALGVRGTQVRGFGTGVTGSVRPHRLSLNVGHAQLYATAVAAMKGSAATSFCVAEPNL
jgi:hypothetical protein